MEVQQTEEFTIEDGVLHVVQQDGQEQHQVSGWCTLNFDLKLAWNSLENCLKID
jgi:hypothetical protein